jgi:Fe-S-cluster containining protein
MTKREQAKAMKALYARLPRVQCQRKCSTSCSIFLVSAFERDKAERQTGRSFTLEPHPLMNGLPLCSMLTKDGDCGIHPIRPLICRMWGAVPEMPCPFDCEIENPVPPGKVYEFLRESFEIGGGRQEAEDQLNRELGKVFRANLMRVKGHI